MTKSPGKKKSSREAAYGLLILQVVVLVGAALCVFSPALTGEWLWNDDNYLARNPLLHDPGRWWKIWVAPENLAEYYPLTATVQWLQWQLWGTDTFGYHLTSVVLHVISSLLAWRLLGKLGLRLAWLGGLLFALHPVMVESVVWISQFKNVLSLPPFLLALCAWIDYEDKKRDRDYFLAVAFFLVAMLCKISMVTFPLVILLYAWWKRGRIAQSDLFASAPFFIISLVLGGINLWSELAHLPADATPLGGFFPRLACSGIVISFYILKCIWPVGLVPLYPRWPVDPPSVLQFLPWLVLGGLAYWLWTKRQAWGRHVILGLGFFLITLAPFLGFIPMGYLSYSWVMDSILYLPILGLIGLLVARLAEIDDRLPALFRPFSIGIAALVLGLLAWQSSSYTKVFSNPFTFWATTINNNPDSFIAHTSYGDLLLLKGRVADASAQYQESLKLNPNYAATHTDLGNVLLQQGRIPEATEQFQTALRLDPNSAEAHYNLGNVLLQENQLDAAIAQYRQSIVLFPSHAETYNNMGIALAKMGRMAEAQAQFEAALRINPRYADARGNLEHLLALRQNPPAKK